MSGAESSPSPGEGLPAAMARLVAALDEAGWTSAYGWGRDSVDHLFVTLEARSPDRFERVRVTWHSRPTGGRTLRLFSAILHQPYRGWRDVTLVKLHEHLGVTPSG